MIERAGMVTIEEMLEDLKSRETTIHVYSGVSENRAIISVDHGGFGFQWFFSVHGISYTMTNEPSAKIYIDWYYELTRVTAMDGKYATRHQPYTDTLMDLLVPALEDTTEDNIPDAFHKIYHE